MGIVGIRQPEFGQRLRRLRRDRGLSQRDVAGSVVNPSYISLLESGARVPTLEVALRIAGTLRVAPEELVGHSVPTGVAARTPGAATGGCRLVHDVLVRSALDVGAWEQVRDRAERRHADAVGAGDLEQVLASGIVLHDAMKLRGDHRARRELLVGLVAAAEEFGVPELVVKLRLDLASAARDCGRLVEALGPAESAMAVLPRTELAGTSEHIRALGVLISVKVDSGDTGDIDALIGTMIGLAEALGSPTVLGRSHWAAATAYSRTGDPDRTRHHVGRADRMLAHPETSLRDWGRFARAAASALLDTRAPVAEVDRYMAWMRAALELTRTPHEHEHANAIEARYALRTGNPRQALALTATTPATLTTIDAIRHHHTRAHALHRTGHTTTALTTLRQAAQLAEQHTHYRLATQLWRDIDAIRTSADSDGTD